MNKSTATVWTPQPKQAVFLSRPEREALYGGAAGGGKSEALLMEAMRQVSIPHYRALILRKTFPQLRELIDKSMRFKRIYPKAKYNSTGHCWTFPSGAKIYFGSMQHTQDRIQYQGQAYDFIGFDELTHFTWAEYSYMFSRNRPTGPGTKVYMRATANPGNIGHGWVKARFVTAGPPMDTIWSRLTIEMPEGGTREVWSDRIFIPASVFDNPTLLENDPNYLANLASLPEAERKALLYGDWDSFEGQVFTEWRDQPEHYIDRVGTHVIAPFRIPDYWPVYCSFDWGFSKPFSVGWYAVDQDGRLYRIREYYGCTGQADVGLQLDPEQVARNILAIEAADPNLKGKNIIRVGDPAIWGSNGGASIGATMERELVYFRKGNHDRLSGKMQVHRRLKLDAEGLPMLYVFSTCRNFIRTVPNLVYSASDVEDVDTKQEDHIYDELRYVCMLNPLAAIVPEPVKALQYDPFDRRGPQDEYAWYRRT